MSECEGVYVCVFVYEGVRINLAYMSKGVRVCVCEGVNCVYLKLLHFWEHFLQQLSPLICLPAQNFPPLFQCPVLCPEAVHGGTLRGIWGPLGFHSNLLSCQDYCLHFGLLFSDFQLETLCARRLLGWCHVTNTSGMPLPVNLSPLPPLACYFSFFFLFSLPVPSPSPPLSFPPLGISTPHTSLSFSFSFLLPSPFSPHPPVSLSSPLPSPLTLLFPLLPSSLPSLPGVLCTVHALRSNLIRVASVRTGVSPPG